MDPADPSGQASSQRHHPRRAVPSLPNRRRIELLRRMLRKISDQEASGSCSGSVRYSNVRCPPHGRTSGVADPRVFSCFHLQTHIRRLLRWFPGAFGVHLRSGLACVFASRCIFSGRMFQSPQPSLRRRRSSRRCTRTTRTRRFPRRLWTTSHGEILCRRGRISHRFHRGIGRQPHTSRKRLPYLSALRGMYACLDCYLLFILHPSLDESKFQSHKS